jgi:hypothetical protein
MVPEEAIWPGAEASVQPFLSESRKGGYMNTQGIFDTGEEALALQSAADWTMPDTEEPAGWLVSGCLEAGEMFPEAPGFGPDQGPFAFGDEDDDDDADDDEDNFDDMEDDFEDDFEDEDDDFEDEDDDFEDEDEEDDFDYDEDGDYDDDFEE